MANASETWLDSQLHRLNNHTTEPHRWTQHESINSIKPCTVKNIRISKDILWRVFHLMWACASLFRRFMDTVNVYETDSVKIRKTNHKTSVDIRIFSYSVRPAATSQLSQSLLVYVCQWWRDVTSYLGVVTSSWWQTWRQGSRRLDDQRWRHWWRQPVVPSWLAVTDSQSVSETCS